MSIIYTQEYPCLKKLLEEHGPTETGRLLGVSGTNFSPSSLKKGVRPVLELAAKQILAERGQSVKEGRTYIMKIDAAHQDAVEKVVKALGGRLIAVQF